MTDFPWPVHPAAAGFLLLEGAELAALAEDIRENGLLEPIWLWDDPERGTVLLDGRNRYRACVMAGCEEVARSTARTYRGHAPYSFTIGENVKRRHMSVGQIAAITDRFAPHLAAEAGMAMAAAARDAAADRDRDEAGLFRADADKADGVSAGQDVSAGQVQGEADLPHPGPDLRKRKAKQKKRGPQARDNAAAMTGISGRALAQFQRIRKQAPDLAAKVEAGEISLDRAERIIRDRVAEQRRIEQARAEAAAVPEPARIRIEHGDFREVLADVHDIDAVITDPPYPREFLPLFADLAAWADKALKPDGILVVLSGQTHLPEVYRLLDGHRPYRWTACYLATGPGYVSHPRKVQSQWKPLLIYGGGPRFADVIRSEGTGADARNNHAWGQDYNAFHTIIERLTARGQTVCDPFMGSGTTLLAAKALGRHVIGCDIDETHVARARERVA